MPNIFEAKTVQTSVIRYLFEALKEIITDGNIILDNTGIKISTMDSSQTLLVYLKLNNDKFEYYHCSSRMIIGVNMLNLFKIIKTVTHNDTLTMYIEENDINKLCIRITNEEKNDTTTYKLKLMDINDDNMDIPPEEFSSVLTMPSSDFQKKCRDMNIYTDVIEIKNIGDNIILSGVGDSIEQETILGPTKDGLSIVKNDDEIIQGYYNLKSLVLFTKCTNLCNNIEIYMQNNYPIIIKYDVGDLGLLRLCLSPKSEL